MYALVKCTLLKFWNANNIFPCLHEAIEFLHFKVRTFRFYLQCTVFKIDNFACRMYCFLTAVFLLLGWFLGCLH